MTKHTPQLESAILDGFAEGLSLSMACRRHDVSRSTFLKWKAADPALAERYAATQLLHAESLVDECLEIADDTVRIEGDAALARYTRMQIDTRLKVARLYFKRHEEAAQRRAREEERRQAQLAAEPDAPLEPPAEDKAAQSAPLRFPVPAPEKPLRLAPAAVAPEPEPERQRRYAGARR